MENTYNNFDVNALPVHLFVKSQKEAKKIDKQSDMAQTEPYIFKKGKRFKTVGHNYTL